MSHQASRGGRARIWRRFVADLIVPVLLSGYATHYYLSVARLPRSQTNMLLIGPVYWILVTCCVVFVGLRLSSSIQAHQASNSEEEQTPGAGVPLFRAFLFIGLTIAYIWALPVIGFVTSTAAYTFVMLLVLRNTSVPVLTLTPIMLAVSLWLSLEKLLLLSLPKGLLF